MSALSSAINIGNTVGKGIVTFRFFIALCISVVFFGIGYNLYKAKEKYTQTTSATITSSDCEPYTSTETTKNKTTTQTKYRCPNVEYEFSLHNKDKSTKYTGSTYTDTTINYKEGNNISIQYDPNNPNDNRLTTMSSKTIGKVMMGIGIVIFLTSLITFLIVWNVRGAGSAYTAYSAYQAMTNNNEF